MELFDGHQESVNPINEYHIFISYSRTDQDIVGPLVQLLRITGDRIFRDVDNITPGSKWRAVLTSTIDCCEILLLFWCRHSSESAEVKKEYTQAIKRGKRVVPVLLDDTILPAKLSVYQVIDLQPVLGGHKEGYVEVERIIPGFKAGGERTERVRQWVLFVPGPCTLKLVYWYLMEALERILHTDQSAD